MHVGCGGCGAALTLEAHLRTATCPYCASPSIVERPSVADRPPPSFTIGFGVAHEAAREAVRQWQKSRGFFTHSGLKTASIDSVKGLYVPAYLYTAIAHSSYDAEIGENYQETETYTTTDSKGNTVVRTRTVTKTEWRSLSGQHSAYMMDVLVTASRGVSNAELELVEPFDFKTLRRYTPALLSGWIAEDPTMTLDECIALARGETLAKVGSALNAFMPGDSQRGLTYQTRFERETIDLVHVPLWILAVRHDPQKPPVRLIVNGQTAKVSGKAPLSWIKIVLVVLAVLLPVSGGLLWMTYATPDEPAPPSPRTTTPATTSATPPTTTASPLTAPTTTTTTPKATTKPTPPGTTPATKPPAGTKPNPATSTPSTPTPGATPLPGAKPTPGATPPPGATPAPSAKPVPKPPAPKPTGGAR